MLKIAILGSRGYPYNYSGYETFVAELAPRLAQRGHQVTVYARRSLFSEHPKMVNGVRLVYLPSIEHKILSTLTHGLCAMSHAAYERPNVVLALNVANGFFGPIARMRGIPCVINVDGLEWHRPKWNWVGQQAFTFAAWCAVWSYSRIITDAQEMARIYREKFGSNSTTIAYGAESYISRKPQLLDQWHLAPGQYVFSASRLVPDNSGELLVQGYIASQARLPYLVAGSADYRGNGRERLYQQRLRDLAGDKVKFIGHVHCRETFQELLANCGVYLHGHQHGGINPSLLQAMGAGAPVMALDTPFVREVITNGRNGILFSRSPSELGQKIAQLLATPDQRAKLGEAARETVQQRFRWDQVVDQYEELFYEVGRRSSCSS